jgi:hypothetical protein
VPGDRPGPGEAAARLEELAGELDARGWPAWVDTQPGRPPRLHARNPETGATALSEQIYAHPLADGTWTYWWSWAEPITPDPASTADAITRVLRTATGAGS